MRLSRFVPSVRTLTLSLVALAALLSVTGCTARGGLSSAIANAPITATAGRSTTPLPSDVPLVSHAVLVQEYAGTLNAHAATVWFYTVLGTDVTPTSVIAFYQSTMPTNGWTAIAVPSETAQGKYGGAALAYQQGTRYATIAAGLDSSYPHAVALLITVAQ